MYKITNLIIALSCLLLYGCNETFIRDWDSTFNDNKNIKYKNGNGQEIIYSSFMSSPYSVKFIDKNSGLIREHENSGQKNFEISKTENYYILKCDTCEQDLRDYYGEQIGDDLIHVIRSDGTIWISYKRINNY